MSFVKRSIQVTFSANSGSFGGGAGNVVTITGLRVSATIVKSGGAAMGQSQFRIFGLSSDLMQKLSTYGLPPNTATGNSIQIEAGDADGGLVIIFVGTIIAAWADYTGVPEVCFNVEALTSYLENIKPAAPSSYAGAANVADILAALAKTCGYDLDNNGVDTQLTDSYFWGTARVQIDECCKAAGIEYVIEDNVLAIWPKGSYRASAPAPAPPANAKIEQITVIGHRRTTLIAPGAGLVGYPTFTNGGVIVRIEPIFKIKFGSLLTVSSNLKNASGIWKVTSILYRLDSETLDGDWFMDLQAYKPNLVANV